MVKGSAVIDGSKRCWRCDVEMPTKNPTLSRVNLALMLSFQDVCGMIRIRGVRHPCRKFFALEFISSGRPIPKDDCQYIL